MKLYHGSEKEIKSGKILEGFFHGMFFSYDRESANGLGEVNFVYSTELDEDDVISTDEMAWQYEDETYSYCVNEFGENAQLFFDLITENKHCAGYGDGLVSPEELKIVMKITGASDDGEADWLIQKEQSKAADAL